MARCTSHGSMFDNLLNFWVDWQIPILMIITMSLQLFLVLAGFFRKHTSNPALHASVWVAFLSLDVSGLYALGLMLASGCGNVFSLYAPILLFHLGAADAINAYAPADNDLWRRYGFKMALEIIAAAYIVSRSSGCPNFTRSGVLLFVVGAFKYGERIFALLCGSQQHILASTRQIYKYMALDHHTDFDLIVSGEQEWYQKHSKEAKATVKGMNAVVTFTNIKDCQSLLKLMGHGIIEDVCLAYALFKVFRRRLANLPIHHKDKDYANVRDILHKLKAEQISKVIDLELSFIFDGLFSKGSAGRLYQGIGVMSRLVSAVFLLTATIELIILDRTHFKCSEKIPVPFAVGLTNLLVIAALVIECLQIQKIVRSNWLRVWLACNYITEGRLATTTDSANEPGHHHGQCNFVMKGCSAAATMDSANNPHQQRWRGLHHFNQRVIACAFRYVGNPKSSHWNFKLEQLSIMVDSLNLVRRHYLLHFEIELLCEVQNLQLEMTNLLAEVNMEKLQAHLVEEIVKRYKDIFSFVKLGQLKMRIQKEIKTIEFNEALGLDLFTEDSGVEDIVLNCHLFTSVFEVKLLNMPNCGSICQDIDVKMSIGLSRYCMHLMIRRPKLMPEDPDIAKGLYSSIKQQLRKLFLANYMKGTNITISCALIKGNEDLDVSNVTAMRLATSMLSNMSEEGLRAKARSLAKVWVDILIYIIIATDNAHPHTEQMSKGGELLTHLWVLLGHLGPGHRSLMDSKSQRQGGEEESIQQ